MILTGEKYFYEGLEITILHNLIFISFIADLTLKMAAILEIGPIFKKSYFNFSSCSSIWSWVDRMVKWSCKVV